MQNDSREYIIELYDIYSNLLTEKQKQYFEDYYFMDLSLSEIAENYSISRNGVYDQIKRVEQSLFEYEAKLSIYKKINMIESLDIDKKIKEDILSILKEYNYGIW